MIIHVYCKSCVLSEMGPWVSPLKLNICCHIHRTKDF